VSETAGRKTRRCRLARGDWLRRVGRRRERSTSRIDNAARRDRFDDVCIVDVSVDTLPEPICREVVVIKDEMPMQACMLSQPALADWKERSIYRGDQWLISRIKCVPGDYLPKERV
jgi:hypothetical protein